MEWNVSVALAVKNAALPHDVLVEFEKVEFLGKESYCLDFKRDGYRDDVLSLAEAVKDIASFYNTYGGFIVFGIEEVERDVRHRVTGISTTPFNMQLVRGKIESWLSEDIPFQYSEVRCQEVYTVGILCIPKRPNGARPNHFKKKGPESKPNKFAFDAGSVAIRMGDKSKLATEIQEWQLVLGTRELDSIASDLGRLIPQRRSGAALDHNLPSRATICAHFIGRSDVLTKLWTWLSDEFQYAKIIAGEGGKGKTSVAYEFATQVASLAPLGIGRIVWLTAKKSQFSGIENSWIEMPETHFSCFRTMLIALGRNLAYSDEELVNASESELQRLIRSELNIQPTLFVLDDIDSLGLDDQRRALEFAQQAGAETVRFLLTTRSNASYSSTAAITLGGLVGEDYRALVTVLSERFGIALAKSDIGLLEIAAQGSPLLTESMLRVVKRGSPLHKAIDEWKGQSGDDARNAVLGREISQLSREAQRILLCLAFLGQCSKAELLTSSGVLELRLEDALEELQSLFILSSPKIIESEPRFEISITVALLVISKRAELAGDHAAIEKKIRSARAKLLVGATQKHNKNVAIAISQALALVKNGQHDSARATIDAALKSQKGHPDLLLFKGRLFVEAKPPQPKEARKLFSEAYDKGVRKSILFDLWYKCERDLSFGPGVIDVTTRALKEFPSDEALWCGRRADGYVLNGLVRIKNREVELAIEELSVAARELHHAQIKASESERPEFEEFLFGVHDQLLLMLPDSSALSRTDIVSVLREMTDRGDLREEIVGALANALLALHSEMVKRGSGTSSQKERFFKNRLYVLDLLRAAGLQSRGLYRQISDLKIH